MRMTEEIFLRLRTAEGLDPAAFSRRFGISFEKRFGKLVQELEAEGLLQRSDHGWAPTVRGMRFADHVAGRFIERV